MWTPASNIMGRGRGDGGGGGHNNMGGVAEMQMQRPPNWSTIQQQQCNMPVNQNMYQNIPHEQIDWAALAQQWIQMRETGPGGVVVDIGPPGPHFQGVHHGMHERLPPHHLRMANAPLIPPVVHVPHSRPHQPPPTMASVPTAPHQHPMVRPPRDMVGINTADNSNSQDIYDTGGEWSSYWSGPQHWGPNAHPHSHQHGQQAPPNWAPPPAERKVEGPGSFDYGGHMHGNHGFAPQTYDYNHGTDHIGLPQGPVQGGEPAQFSCPSGGYWASSGPAAPPFLRRDMNDYIDQIPPGSASEEDLNAMPTLDAAKRKNLPAWIRDGLEKMEREKQKKLEREEMLKQRELRLEAQREEEEKAIREFHARTGDDGDIKVDSSAEAAMPSKSKFESDSEGADDSDDERVESDSETRSGSTAQRGLKSSPSPKSRTPTPPPFEPLMSEQERMEAMMAKVRRLLTEILLEVTNEEIESIAKEVFSKARAKAPARQLAKSSALASITGNLGLGGYSSGSDDSEGSDKDDLDEEENDDGVDSDAELQEKIHRRRLEFAQREKELTYGDETSLDSSHDVRGDEGESANDSDGKKGGFEDSAEKDEVKSKARSDFEKKWYSSDVKVEEESIGGGAVSATNQTSTVGSAESSETFSGNHAAQGESKRSRNQNDDDNSNVPFRVKRSSDAKRSVSERDSRSRSRSRDRGGGDSESKRRLSHRSVVRQSQSRRSSRTPEKRDRRGSRDRLERARTTGHAAENRRRNRSTRSKSADRSRRRRSRTRSRDREYRGRKRQQRSYSSSSSSSSSGASRKAESRIRKGSSRGSSTTTNSRRGRNGSGSRKRRSESTSSVSSSSSRRKKKTSTTSIRSSGSSNNVNKTDSRNSSSKHRGSSSKSEATTSGRSRNK